MHSEKFEKSFQEFCVRVNKNSDKIKDCEP